MNYIETNNAPAAVGPYCQGVAVGGLLFISGQLPINPKTGKFPSDDAVEQLRQCMENIAAIAEAAGSGLSRAVKTTVLVTDLGQFAELNAAYATYFPDRAPARACYEVSALPKGAKVEIEAVVAL